MSHRRSADAASVEEEVAALGNLDLYAMRERWHQLFGNPPPKSLRWAFLLRACAFQTRVRALGGLSAITQRRLKKIAEGVRSGRTDGIVAPRRVSAGTRLVRSWRGQIYVVTTRDDGRFEWNGATYRSLSAIAKAITGTNWNGRVFFGLKQLSEPRKSMRSRDQTAATPAGKKGAP